jgi:hypothetical protein
MMEEKKHNIILPEKIITSKIYLIRDKKVMLDNDLAELYKVETRRLNEQVKRNIVRFPEDFMFQLSHDEYENLMSQIATSRRRSQACRQASKKMPYKSSLYGI